MEEIRSLKSAGRMFVPLCFFTDFYTCSQWCLLTENRFCLQVLIKIQHRTNLLRSIHMQHPHHWWQLLQQSAVMNTVNSTDLDVTTSGHVSPHTKITNTFTIFCIPKSSYLVMLTLNNISQENCNSHYCSASTSVLKLVLCLLLWLLPKIPC